MDWKCAYCKETLLTNSRRSNCDLCSTEITAKRKLGRVRTEIRKLILNNKKETKIIDFLKTKKNIYTIKLARHFHGSDEDVIKIIDNYFDKTKPLPIITVNGCIGYVDLNKTRKKKT